LDGEEGRPLVWEPTVMRHFLRSQCGQHERGQLPDLVELPSRPSTLENCLALRDYLQYSPLDGRIALLTNFYHLPRALRLLTPLISQPVLPICAEAVLLDLA